MVSDLHQARNQSDEVLQARVELMEVSSVRPQFFAKPPLNLESFVLSGERMPSMASRMSPVASRSPKGNRHAQGFAHHQLHDYLGRP